ncbi:hypothetical protein EFA46_002220 [Halarchaeum sp. CBA1220]|uniref:hypothetical protein n=1 Tax=Halarchaeum sp. CBA1220 TaxID=1853682 RepID=UPI000F3A9919|nr:hypothetical protein [Halarchaeum sp. CBA1220]QLC33071.1 hypothetical protein EFA46_002220 [Halarchaeum sp. CBA1220]
MTHPLPPDAVETAAVEHDLTVERLDALLARVADYFRGKERALERQYEAVVDADDGRVLLADAAFWTRTGDALGYDEAETAAVRAGHEATLRLAGRHEERDAEFASALEIRTAVVLGR